ncbi:MAG: hypothetical protein H7Y08_10275 [Rhizobiaceae bacterium]|nr:hypothetical protein [Rhizobiaceae bacterium]
MISLVFGTAVAVFLGAASIRPGEAACGDFAGFWTKFQAAAKGGAGRPSALARTPIDLRGELDGDAVETIDEAAFDERFDAWLEIDPGLSAEPTTARALILSTSAASAEADLMKGDAEARVGPFTLSCESGRWAIARVYAAAE